MRRIVSTALALLFGFGSAYADTPATTSITAGPGVSATASTTLGGPTTIGLFDAVNAVGTNGGTHAYTLNATDYGKFLTFTDASAFALTLPVGSTTGFGTGYFVTLTNYGAGTITATPTTSTINNGGSSLTLAQNTQCTIFLDAASPPNYQLGPCSAVAPSGGGGGAGSFTTLTASAAVNFNMASANFSCAPTGTGQCTINPATASNINNEAIGQTTPLAGTFTNLSATTLGAPFGIAAQKNPDNTIGSVGWVDDAATNLSLGSDNFANATYWTPNTGLVMTANSIESPNGGTNAAVATSQPSGTQTITSASAATISSGANYTNSFYAKAGSGVTWVLVANQNTGITKYALQWFNISTCAVGSAGGTSATIVSASGYSVGNSWCRFSTTFNYTDTTNKQQFQPTTTNGGFGSPANGSTFYIWGNDLTSGTMQHSHIPTLATAIASPAGISSLSNLTAFGHVVSFGTTLPTVSSCGSGSPTVTAGSTDLRGSVTVGTSATTCTISFAQGFAAAPFCTVSDSSSTIPVGINSTSTSGFVTTMGSLSGAVIYWICIG